MQTRINQHDLNNALTGCGRGPSSCSMMCVGALCSGVAVRHSRQVDRTSSTVAACDENTRAQVLNGHTECVTVTLRDKASRERRCVEQQWSSQ